MFFRALMGTLKFCLSGAFEGSAGTGKTEICRDFSKAIAKKCIVFSCSNRLDHQVLGKLIKVNLTNKIKVYVV